MYLVSLSPDSHRTADSRESGHSKSKGVAEGADRAQPRGQLHFIEESNTYAICSFHLFYLIIFDSIHLHSPVSY